MFQFLFSRLNAPRLPDIERPSTPREQLLHDLKEVQKVFSSPGFRGRFDMNTFGLGNREDPGDTFNGVRACEAGWLNIVTHRGEWIQRRDREYNYSVGGGVAARVYGLNDFQEHVMFHTGFEKSLQQKIREAIKLTEPALT